LRVHTTNDKAEGARPSHPEMNRSCVWLGPDAADKSTQHSNQFATASAFLPQEERSSHHGIDF
jgi:hypothetical protein